MFWNFQTKVFFEESFDMNGGKEEATKLDKSLDYCKEVAGGGSKIFFPWSHLCKKPFAIPC